jgi:hypothetical protein
VSAGHYQWYRGELEYQSKPAQQWSFKVGFSCCNYYAGRSVNSNATLDWRPNASFGVSVSQDRQQITQPGGHFSIHIDTLNASAYFTPTMVLDSQLQYDNVSRRLAASIRFKWQLKPATDLFAALGEAASLSGPVTDASYHSQGTALILRVGHRLQY